MRVRDLHQALDSSDPHYIAFLKQMNLPLD